MGRQEGKPGRPSHEFREAPSGSRAHPRGPNDSVWKVPQLRSPTVIIGFLGSIIPRAASATSAAAHCWGPWSEIWRSGYQE